MKRMTDAILTSACRAGDCQGCFGGDDAPCPCRCHRGAVPATREERARMNLPRCVACFKQFDHGCNSAYCSLTCEEQDQRPVFLGFSQQQLREAFDMVKNRSNWKFAINAVIDSEYASAAEAAVCFYAGGGVSLTPARKGKVRITAPGYYALIGS